MKANQLFRGRDEAVSPVIAVILMVAITVVLAATVYVWVSGFGAQSGNPQKSIALTSAGALSSSGWKNYTVASGTSGMRWSDIAISVNGVAQTLDSGVSCSTYTTTGANYFLACQGTSLRTSGQTISAGDTISLHGLSAGQTLRITDAQANAVILTLTVG